MVFTSWSAAATQPLHEGASAPAAVVCEGQFVVMSERSRDVDGGHRGDGRRSGVNHGARLFPRWSAVTRSEADSSGRLAVVCGGSETVQHRRACALKEYATGVTNYPCCHSLQSACRIG